MGKPIDLVGHPPFGRLTVLRRSGRRLPGTGRKARERGWTVPLWECECECGAIVLTTTARLRSGNTESCGCLQRDKARVSGQKAARHATPKQCRHCGAAFAGTRKQRYCGRVCKEAAQLAPRRPIKCTYCGKSVPAARSDQSYCSDRCHRRAGYRQEKARKAARQIAATAAELNRRLTDGPPAT